MWHLNNLVWLVLKEMGPPPPAGEEKIVILKAVGGEIGSASSLAPKLGPLGLVCSNSMYSYVLIRAVSKESW